MTAEFALLRKEMLIHLRGRRPFISLIVLFLFNGFLLLLLWPVPGSPFENHPLIIHQGIASLLGFFLVLSNSMIPNLCATMFTLEKEWGTYDLLRGIPISPWKIVLGKVGIAVLYIHVLYAALLPILLAWTQIGWLQIEQIGKFYLLFLGTMLLNALFSLWISIVESHSALALKKASGYIFFCLCGMSLCGYFLLWLLSLFLPIPPGMEERWWELSAPVYSFKVIFFKPTSTSWVLNPLFFLTLSVLLFGRIVYQLEKDPEKSLNPPQKQPLSSRPVSKWLTRIEDPILKKELLMLYTPLSWSRLVTKIGLFVLLFLWFFLIRIRVADWLEPQEFLSFQILIFSFSAVSATALLLAKELASENFDLLRTTLIFPSEFLGGKLKMSFLLLGNTLLWCMVLNYLLVGTYSSGKTISFLYITLCNLELLLVLGVTLILSLSAAALFKEGQAVLQLAYFFYLLFSVVVFFFAALFYWWGWGIYPRWLFAFSPITGIYSFYDTKGISWMSWMMHLAVLGFWGGVGSILGIWGLKRRWVDP